MKKLIDPQVLKASLRDIYSPKDEESCGRLISLGSSLTASIYNVFITGIFYTGFLSMYGISITGVGIVSFIPYLANCFSVLSPAVLRHFKKRKPVLLAAKIFFYAMYILATTLMPTFVTDPDARLGWFIGILFVGYSVYALFSPGLTAWFARFFPQQTEKRVRYFAYNQVISSIMSSTMLLVSGLITDAVQGSPVQQQIILTMRYIAFGLVLVDCLMQSRAAEAPAKTRPAFRLRETFTLPVRHRRFLYCMILQFCWNFIANLNNGMWNYHLLNHMRFSYTLINLMSVMYTCILLLTQNLWRRFIRDRSWVAVFGLCNLVWFPTEILCFLMIPERSWMFVPVCFMQNILNVGFNLSYANILYLNLPKDEDITPYISFNTIGCNVFAFLGLLTGTFVSSVSGDLTLRFLGMDIWSVQFSCLMRGVTMLCMGIVLTRKWRSFTPAEDVEEVERLMAFRKQRKAVMKARRNYRKNTET